MKPKNTNFQFFLVLKISLSKFSFRILEYPNLFFIISTIDSVAYYINYSIYFEKIVKFRDSVIFFKNIYVPKTKWQTRIDYRYKTKILKQDVLKYKYIYKDSKENRKEVQQTKRRTNWNLFLWGFVSGVGLFFLLRLLDKLRKII